MSLKGLYLERLKHGGAYFQNFMVPCCYSPYTFFVSLKGLVRNYRGGKGGVETEGGSQLFETAEKGGVMKNEPLKGEGSYKYVSVIM